MVSKSALVYTFQRSSMESPLSNVDSTIDKTLCMSSLIVRYILFCS